MSYVCSLIHLDFIWLLLFQPFLGMPMSLLQGFHYSNILSPLSHRFKNNKRLQFLQEGTLSWTLLREFSCPRIQRTSSGSGPMAWPVESMGVYDPPALPHFLLNSFPTLSSIYSLAAQRGSSRVASPGSLLEMENLGPTSDQLYQNLYFNKICRLFWNTVKMENYRIIEENFWNPSSRFSHPHSFLAAWL